MDRYKLLVLLLTLGVFLGCSTPEEKKPTADQMVLTGLYYEDHQPITLTIEGGLITSISREVTGETPIYYISPGLIDHQVNGYLSHSFWTFLLFG